ncbi:MAG: DUF2063 domain-containing protein [Gammaproteobacteria bacterium]
MSELRELQESFQKFVLSGMGDLKENISSGDEVVVDTRAAIYYDGYRLRLTEVLRTDFPGLHTLSGDDQFEKICQEYIKNYPSDHFSARYFGRFMQEFLSKTEPYSKHRMLADIAGFEWTVNEVLDAADQTVFSMQELQAISPTLWPEMAVVFHSSLSTIELQSNVPKFWQLVKEEQQPEKPTQNSKTVVWALWRKGIDVYFRSLEEDEAWALEASQKGSSFAEICEGLCQWNEPENVAVRMVSFIQHWISDEMISSIKT